MWLIWLLVAFGIFALVGAISTHSDTVVETAKSDNNARLLRQRCEAYSEYIRRTFGHAGLGAMGPAELLTHIETAAMRAIASRKEVQDTFNGMVAIGIIATVIAFFWGAGSDNAGIAVPVGIGCAFLGFHVVNKANSKLAETNAAIARDFGIDPARLQTLIEGVAT